MGGGGVRGIEGRCRSYSLPSLFMLLSYPRKNKMASLFQKFIEVFYHDPKKKPKSVGKKKKKKKKNIKI